MKRKFQESQTEFEIRRDEYLGRLRINTATIIACQAHLENAAKAIEDDYPQINISDEFAEVFANLDLIGDRITRFAEEVED